MGGVGRLSGCVQIEDYNFGTLLRTDAKAEYGEKTTIFGQHTLTLLRWRFGVCVANSSRSCEAFSSQNAGMLQDLIFSLALFGVKIDIDTLNLLVLRHRNLQVRSSLSSTLIIYYKPTGWTNNHRRNRHGLNDWIKEKQDKEDAEKGEAKASK